MMSFRKYLILSILSICAVVAIAQDGELDPMATGPAAAKQFFEMGDYKDALREYLKIVAEKPDDDEANYRVGVCYLNTNIAKPYAISYLKKSVDDKKYMPDALFQLAQAYHYSDSIDEAITLYKEYEKIADDGAKKVLAAQGIEMCNSAKKFMEVPLNVTFENLGKKVNSDEPDYNPFIPVTEEFIVFSTKRKQATGGQVDYDGYKPADVFYCDEDDGEFGRARSVGALVNSEWVEEVAGLSANGDYLLIAIDNFEGFDDIWVSEAKRKGKKVSWQKSYSIGFPINSEEAETTGNLSPDGQTAYFARTPLNVPGFGGTDIYVARKLPNGEWTDPINLGPTINTQYDEDFPRVSEDGKTLYFASKGHNSMGGYDVFRSQWDDRLKRWSRPENLGYPLNDTQDNFTFSMSETGRYGYLSKVRPEGFGDLDIYKVIFNEIDEKKSGVVGHIDLMIAPEPNAVTWDVYEKNGVKENFPDWFNPSDYEAGWTFVEKNKEEIPDGYSYLIGIIAKVDGQIIKITRANIPSTSSTVEITRVSSQKVRVQGASVEKAEPKAHRLEDKPEVDVTINLTDQESGDLFGTYVPNKKNGNYVMVLPPGKYKMEVTAPGFHPYTKVIGVYDKSSYQRIISRDIMLYDENMPNPEPSSP